MIFRKALQKYAIRTIYEKNTATDEENNAQKRSCPSN